MPAAPKPAAVGDRCALPDKPNCVSSRRLEQVISGESPFCPPTVEVKRFDVGSPASEMLEARRLTRVAICDNPEEAPKF